MQDQKWQWTSCFVVSDLSFNNIEVVEGLDTLTKIKDLSLAHNRIKALGGLDKLVELHVLSIGHNKLAKTEEVGGY